MVGKHLIITILWTVKWKMYWKKNQLWKTLSRGVRKIAMPVQFEDKTVKYIVKNAVASYNGKKGDVEGATNP